MFEPTEFIDGPRNGESVPFGELPGQLEFPNGVYRLTAPNGLRAGDTNHLPDLKKMIYVWEEADNS